jgi:hypothetical protein
VDSAKDVISDGRGLAKVKVRKMTLKTHPEARA